MIALLALLGIPAAVALLSPSKAPAVSSAPAAAPQAPGFPGTIFSTPEMEQLYSEAQIAQKNAALQLIPIAREPGVTSISTPAPIAALAPANIPAATRYAGVNAQIRTARSAFYTGSKVSLL